MRFEQKLFETHNKAHNVAFNYYLRKGFIPLLLSEILVATRSLQAFLKYNPDPPRVPAGSPDGGQWTSGGDGGNGGDGLEDAIGNAIQTLLGIGSAEAADMPATPSDVPASWGNPDTFIAHANDHAADFNVTSPQDYAYQANQFYQRYLDQDLPAISYPNGSRIAVYDPPSNTFGVYNPDGTTVTFYKPTEGVRYYNDLVNTQLERGGQIINPLPSLDGGINRTGKPGDITPKPWEITE